MSGFKSLRDPTEIVVRPLTVLCGANSSGKSSIMQPLLLLKQTLEAPYDPGPLLLDGENVSFSVAKEMLWRGRGQDAATEMSVGYRDFDGEETALYFRPVAHGVDLDRVEHADPPGNGAFSLHPGLSQKRLLEILPQRFRSILEKEQIELAVRRRRCFFEISWAPAGEDPSSLPGLAVREFTTMRTMATNLLHLPGLRDNPARFYPATQVADVFPGVFQPYVASVIANWMDTGDPRLAKLGQQLQLLGLTWKVESKRLDDTRVALRVGRLQRAAQGGARDMVSIADVGLGISQSLPVLVALLAASPGQIVYLEQPEIHLHPRAQVGLAAVLFEAAQRGVLVVAETHSYLLLKAIQEWAAQGSGIARLVKLHWFSRSPIGITRVDSADLDEAGAFGEWPADFSDVEMEVEDRYLAAAMQQMIG